MLYFPMQMPQRSTLGKSSAQVKSINCIIKLGFVPRSSITELVPPGFAIWEFAVLVK